MNNNDLFSLTDALTNGTLFKSIYKPYTKKIPKLIPENEQEKILMELQQYSVALMDLNLYLDLNPNDKYFNDKYKEYLKEFNDLKKKYGEKYYPLSKHCESIVKNDWQWNKGQWPWEREK